MNKYVLQAMSELEAGNYEAYEVYMKLNRESRISKTWKREIPADDRNNFFEEQTTADVKIETPNDDSSKACKKCRSNGWTLNEEVYLRSHYRSLSDNEIADKLNRTAEAVKARRKKLKLNRGGKLWQDEEHLYIRQNFRNQSLKEMGKALNRPPSQVSFQMHKIGLSKVNRYEMYVAGHKVASGTIKEISEQINANLYTVKNWRTNGVSWATFKKLEAIHD